MKGKAIFEEAGGQPSGGTVTQGGNEKPVLEAIVDMMNAENIKENLKYVVMCVFVCVHADACALQGSVYAILRNGTEPAWNIPQDTKLQNGCF